MSSTPAIAEYCSEISMFRLRLQQCCAKHHFVLPCLKTHPHNLRLETRTEGVEGCSRDELDADTVCYLDTEEQRAPYRVSLVRGNRIVHSCSNEPCVTGPDGWIFVLRDGLLLAAPKRTTPPRFHHSSFYGGEVRSATASLQ
jgi:hypothetical protein